MHSHSRSHGTTLVVSSLSDQNSFSQHWCCHLYRRLLIIVLSSAVWKSSVPSYCSYCSEWIFGCLYRFICTLVHCSSFKKIPSPHWLLEFIDSMYMACLRHHINIGCLVFVLIMSYIRCISWWYLFCINKTVPPSILQRHNVCCFILKAFTCGIHSHVCQH